MKRLTQTKLEKAMMIYNDRIDQIFDNAVDEMDEWINEINSNFETYTDSGDPYILVPNPYYRSLLANGIEAQKQRNIEIYNAVNERMAQQAAADPMGWNRGDAYRHGLLNNLLGGT